MSKNDNLPPLEFQKSAVFDPPVDIAEFCDIDTGRMLLPLQFIDTGALILPPAMITEKRAVGMKLNEAMSEAARWWEKRGRVSMPDARRAQEYMLRYGVASGLLNGVGWEQLAKEEKLKVLRAWWLNIGVPYFVQGLGTSQDDQTKGASNGKVKTEKSRQVENLTREKGRSASAESKGRNAPQILGADGEPASRTRH